MSLNEFTKALASPRMVYTLLGGVIALTVFAVTVKFTANTAYAGATTAKIMAEKNKEDINELSTATQLIQKDVTYIKDDLQHVARDVDTLSRDLDIVSKKINDSAMDAEKRHSENQATMDRMFRLLEESKTN